MYTDEQIQERAKAIGNRPYHPIVFETTNLHNRNGVLTDNNFIYGHSGISIRQEFMRTAMGAMINHDWITSSSLEERMKVKIKMTTDYINATLIQMAKDELGVSDE